jgi:hypothetical protein
MVELLEGRALPGAAVPIERGAVPVPAALVRSRAMTIDQGAVAAIRSSIGGGSGAEWAATIRKQVRNPVSVVARFVSGRITSHTVTGITFRIPATQPAFTGQVYDQLLPTVAGASFFKNDVFEMAAILRGPFRNPATSYYVFALDRGAGASLGPVFADRPGIVADTLVTITVGPFGANPAGELLDLTNSSRQTIDPAKISIRSATLRVLLDARNLPAGLVPISQYRFNMWTQTQPGDDLANVAGFALDDAMARVAVQNSIAVRR